MMHVKNLELTGIKPFDHVVMEELGNMVVLEGVNGVGKTQILTMLIAALQGKTGLPDRPTSEWLKDGYESGVVKIELADGAVVRYVIRLTITADDATVQVKEVGEDGKAREVSGGAVSFLKKIINAIAFRPQAWRKKSDAEQVEEIFKFFPDLKKKLSENDAELEKTKKERAGALSRNEVLRLDISRLAHTPGIPEKETDPAELSAKLKAANEHNSKLEKIKQNRSTVSSEIIKVDSDIAAIESGIARTREMITKLQEQIAADELAVIERRKDLAVTLGFAQKIDEEIAGFVVTPVEPIEAEIAALGKTNEAIRKNAELKRKQKDLEESEAKGQELYKKIESIKSDRLKIMSSAQIPIDGLSIGEGCLMYPNSNMEMTRLSALSDGEFWPVAIGLVAALKPQIGIVVIDNYWDLDKQNFEALCYAAEKYGMQPWIHKTLREESDAEAGFLIRSSGSVEKV